MSTNDISELLADVTDAQDEDLDVETQLVVYGKAERLRGVVLAYQAANEAAEEDGQPDSPSAVADRLRAAVQSLRGQQPMLGEDSVATFQDLVETAEDAGDVVEAIAEDHHADLTDRLGNGDDIRGFQ